MIELADHSGPAFVRIRGGSAFAGLREAPVPAWSFVRSGLDVSVRWVPRRLGGGEPERGSQEWSDDWQDADDWIAERTAAALRQDPLLCGRYLKVLVQNGVVILIGEVFSDDARAAAGRRVWSIPGAFDVCNGSSSPTAMRSGQLNLVG